MTVLALLTAADAGPGLPGPFQINLGLGVLTVIVFLGVLFILTKFVFPTLVKMTAEREASMRRLHEEARQAHAGAQAALEEHRALLLAARTEAQAIVAEARQAADRERSLGIERTRQEQHDLMERARKDIATERDRAMETIRVEAVDLAIAAAGKVVGNRLDLSQDRKLVEEYLASIGPAR